MPDGDAGPESAPRLDPALLIEAYCSGAFPMADPLSGQVDFFVCDPRAIIPLESFRAPRGARRKLERGTFTVTFDRAFESVMRACREARESDGGTWISEAMVVAFGQLHARGHAHSVETWRDGRLVGGLYGVSIGAAFFGESMFSRIRDGGSDASTAALSRLVDELRQRALTLLDCQYANEHTLRLGAIEIPQADYLARLREATAVPDRWPTTS